MLPRKIQNRKYQLIHSIKKRDPTQNGKNKTGHVTKNSIRVYLRNKTEH